MPPPSWNNSRPALLHTSSFDYPVLIIMEWFIGRTSILSRERLWTLASKLEHGALVLNIGCVYTSTLDPFWCEGTDREIAGAQNTTGIVGPVEFVRFPQNFHKLKTPPHFTETFESHYLSLIVHLPHFLLRLLLRTQCQCRRNQPIRQSPFFLPSKILLVSESETFSLLAYRRRWRYITRSKPRRRIFPSPNHFLLSNWSLLDSRSR